MEISLEEMLQYGELYDHRYFSCIGLDERKGYINFKNMEVAYNPLYNEEGETFCHEMFHHYFIKEIGMDVPESIVEQEGLRFYEQYKKEIDEYVRGKLK